MSEFQGKAYPVKNTGTEEIPPYGLVLLHDGDNADPLNPLVEYRVISTKGNDQENEDGTFQSVFHYHNRLGFNSGAKIRADGHGQAYFRLSGPIVAALESDDVTESEMLVATTDSAVLRKLNAGSPGSTGEFTNLFGLFRPLHKLSEKRWLVMHVNSPLFACRAAESAEAGSACVAEIMQHGIETDGEIDVELDTPRYITFFASGRISDGDRFTVGLVSGALIQLGAGGSSSGGGGSVTTGCGGCGPWAALGLTSIEGLGPVPLRIQIENNLEGEEPEFILAELDTETLEYHAIDVEGDPIAYDSDCPEV